MRALIACALLCVSSLLLADCYAPSYSDCAFRCAAKEPACPDEYECQKDGYCHLRGSTAACPFPSVQPDLGALPADAATD